MSDRKKVVRASFALLFVTVIWGATFLWNKDVIDVFMERMGPSGRALGIGIFLAARFGLGALLMLLWPRAREGILTRGAILGGLLIGAILSGGFVLQMFGLQSVGPAVSAFLTSLYVVFTALLGRLRFGRLGGRVWIGVVLATTGAAFIKGPPHLSYGLGEILTILSAAIFAVHILVTDNVTRRAPALAVTVWSFFAGALVGLILAAVALPGAMAESPELLTTAADLTTDPAFFVPALLLVILGTNVALSLMNVYQRELTPVRAAVIYALEPVWAAIMATLFGYELADAWLLVGGLLLICGNLVIELKPRAALTIESA